MYGRMFNEDPLRPQTVDAHVRVVGTRRLLTSSHAWEVSPRLPFRGVGETEPWPLPRDLRL